MNEQLDRAMEKINGEMQKKPDDQYREIIGHYVIDRCVDPAAAELVLKDGKTLEGAMKAVTNAARKRAHEGVAVMSPSQVFGEVDSYFGLAPDAAAQQKAVMSVSAGACAAAEQVREKKVPLNFLDFV